MIIRPYQPTDEQGWVRCRVLAFLDSSYYRDVKTAKEQYAQPSICLVAEENQQIVGLLDVELDSQDLCYTDRGRGAVLWHLAVLPEYRRQGVAAQLWNAAQNLLQAQGVSWCELWTQQDQAANCFYQAMGFELDESKTYLRCYVAQQACAQWLTAEKVGEIYGVEELLIQAPLQRREEMVPLCNQVEEVRLYTKKL